MGTYLRDLIDLIIATSESLSRVSIYSKEHCALMLAQQENIDRLKKEKRAREDALKTLDQIKRDFDRTWA
jgi:hypothetical protein